MDETDAEIAFDDRGICSHCRKFDETTAYQLRSISTFQGKRRLKDEISRIREEGRGNPYDCVVGLSGGVDSTYAAVLCRDLGLRPLAVHFDSGWNTQVAVANIESTLKRLRLDLITEVADWDEMRDLQLSFIKASVPNCDIPQDHGIISTLFHVASRFGIRAIISGGNLVSESVLPRSWGFNNLDLTHLRSVHASHGRIPIRRYPSMSFVQRFVVHPLFDRIRIVRLLDIFGYEKARAENVIQKDAGWRPYGGKHCESVFTRFFQGYYLPRKFGFDKRKAHLSSLILSGQISRKAALAELSHPPIEPGLLEIERRYVAKKFDLSTRELEELVEMPGRSHLDYENSECLYAIATAGRRFIRRLVGVRKA